MSGLYGADVAELRALATQFEQVADRLEVTSITVSNAIQISAWIGPFAASFRIGWDTDHRVKLAHVSTMLRENALKLRANADGQEKASAVEAPVRPCTEDDNGLYGHLDPQVEAEWQRLTDTERRAILRELARRYAAQYGIDAVDVQFEDLEDEPGSNSLGIWSDEKRLLIIDVTDLPNAKDAINTLAHEMRHAGQHEMARDANTNRSAVDDGYQSDFWSHTEATPEEARRWADNFDHYHDPDDNFRKYWEQPVEVDAREAGKAGVESMTIDQLHELAAASSSPSAL